MQLKRFKSVICHKSSLSSSTVAALKSEVDTYQRHINDDADNTSVCLKHCYIHFNKTGPYHVTKSTLLNKYILNNEHHQCPHSTHLNISYKILNKKIEYVFIRTCFRFEISLIRRCILVKCAINFVIKIDHCKLSFLLYSWLLNENESDSSWNDNDRTWY